MKRPTQVDVARLAGVSRSTVSYVINGQTNGRVNISPETQQRVQEAIAELGYVPDAQAQALRSGNTRTIGVMIPSDLQNPHFWQYVDGIAQIAESEGYRLLVSSTSIDPKHEQENLQDLASRRIDGLILQGFLEPTKVTLQTFKQLIKRKLPIVVTGNMIANVDRVWTDYHDATDEVMAHLLSHQHERIGFVFGVQNPVFSVLGEDRLIPYKENLLKAGLPVDESLIVHCGPTIEDGYQAAYQLLSQTPRVTAVLAINDLLAIGILRAAADLGIEVPTQLSVVGYDDIPMARYLKPRLTTVSKDPVAAGKEAMRLILARIQEPDRPVQKLPMPIRFIIRETTGPAPGR
ncbi:MAG: LacI family DNA-binding transcriptional regulator [Anaerolineales bacterium]|nr:LacI family DNA-binding transcriptional regulator [Anaerolineales bacterium]